MNTERHQISAIILAAGLSTRMAPRNKLLTEWQGKPLIRGAVLAAFSASPLEVIVVTGHMRDDIVEALAGLPVKFVHNDDYREGMGASLACGVRHVSRDAGGILVFLGDMPAVAAATIEKLVLTLEAEAMPLIYIPIYEGNRGHPVLFEHSFIDDLARLSGDRGAKSLILGRSDQVRLVDVDDPGILFDIDL